MTQRMLWCVCFLLRDDCLDFDYLPTKSSAETGISDNLWHSVLRQSASDSVGEISACSPTHYFAVICTTPLMQSLSSTWVVAW